LGGKGIYRNACKRGGESLRLLLAGRKSGKKKGGNRGENDLMVPISSVNRKPLPAARGVITLIGVPRGFRTKDEREEKEHIAMCCISAAF